MQRIDAKSTWQSGLYLSSALHKLTFLLKLICLSVSKKLGNNDAKDWV